MSTTGSQSFSVDVPASSKFSGTFGRRGQISVGVSSSNPVDTSFFSSSSGSNAGLGLVSRQDIIPSRLSIEGLPVRGSFTTSSVGTFSFISPVYGTKLYSSQNTVTGNKFGYENPVSNGQLNDFLVLSDNKIDTGIVPSVIPSIQKQDIIVVQKQNIITINDYPPPPIVVNNGIGFVPPPVIPPGLPPGLPGGFPSFAPPGQNYGGTGRSRKQSFKYMPSLTAMTFGIRGKTPKGSLDPLSIRPLPLLKKDKVVKHNNNVQRFSGVKPSKLSRGFR
jgi:hypothetical protein